MLFRILTQMFYFKHAKSSLISVTLLSLLFIYTISTNLGHINLRDEGSMLFTNIFTIVTNKRFLFRNESQCTNLNYINKTVDRNNDLDSYVNICEKKKQSEDKISAMTLCEYCPFKEPVYLKERKPLIALASFQGSGNSWTRELLESLTGIYTGSCYRDIFGQFPGSKYCPGSGKVFIVKTHTISNQTRHLDCTIRRAPAITFEKAMYILRNPYEAMMSTFNLETSRSKVGFARRKDFRSVDWQRFVQSSIQSWGNMTTYWLTIFKNPVYVILYENLTENTLHELNDIGRFLRLQHTYIDLHCAKHCLKVKYHRLNKPYWMNKETVFNKILKQVVNAEIKSVMNKVQVMDDIVKHLNGYIL